MSSSTASSSPTSTVVISTTGTLTKAEFISQADAVCEATDDKLSNLPHAATTKDYPALLTDFSSTQPIYQNYFTQEESLVSRSPDRDKLTTKWLDVERSDFAASVPIINDMVKALQDKDNSSIKSINKKLKSAPDHTNQLISFFNSYGLNACSTMQSDSVQNGD